MNIRTCKECYKSFEDHSTDEIDINLWAGMTSSDKKEFFELALKDQWIYVCPYCDSVFLRTKEEHTTDAANKIMERFMPRAKDFLK